VTLVNWAIISGFSAYHLWISLDHLTSCLFASTAAFVSGVTVYDAEIVGVNPMEKWMFGVGIGIEVGLGARIPDATVLGPACGLLCLLLQPDLGVSRCCQ
jgi:hypothetical protein